MTTTNITVVSNIPVVDQSTPEVTLEVPSGEISASTQVPQELITQVDNIGLQTEVDIELDIDIPTVSKGLDLPILGQATTVISNPTLDTIGNPDELSSAVTDDSTLVSNNDIELEIDIPEAAAYQVSLASIPLITATAISEFIIDVLGYNELSQHKVMFELADILDSLKIIDTVALSISASFQDSLRLGDSIAIDISRGISDGIHVTDIVSLDVSKGFIDSVLLSDAISISIGTSFVDPLVFIDTTTFDTSKLIPTDNLVLQDSILLSTEKGVNDLLVLTDTLQLVAAFVRDFVDDLLLVDNVILDVSTTLLDTIDLSDSIVLSIDNTVLDTIETTDTIFFDLGKGRFDTIKFGDSAVLYMQGYVVSDTNYAMGNGYFLEDYVGEWRTIN
jgi:hypothetical protein